MCLILPGEYGQCRSRHQRVPVLHPGDQGTVAGWKTCGVWQSSGWDGGWSLSKIWGFILRKAARLTEKHYDKNYLLRLQAANWINWVHTCMRSAEHRCHNSPITFRTCACLRGNTSSCQQGVVICIKLPIN